MKIDLHDKNVLVTGASRGIGKAIALAMADCGARVGIHYSSNRKHAQQVVKQIGKRAVLFQADLEDTIQVNEFFHEAISSFGQIHVLVNNAGISIHSDPEGEDMNFVNDWIKTIDVNLNAVGYMCKMAINHFEEFGGGRIINISSRAAFRGDTKDYLAYAASKGGIVSLTRSIARAYGKKGIKAFNIAPGFVRTDMAQQFIDNYGESIILDDIALSKLTEPKDLAPMVALLAAGMADHATGCTIDINAGSYVH
jgi:NAD(P)-dependent dehydrogenase (short-subunit alcohol dehydrogenase family)